MDGAIAGDAGSDATNDEDAGTDEDAGAATSDAGAPASRDQLDWQLADTDGTCTTTLHYTLVRVP